MCGRYWMDDDSLDLRKIAEEMNRSPLMSRWAEIKRSAAVRRREEINGSSLASRQEEIERSAPVNSLEETTAVKTAGEILPTDVVPVIAPDRNGERAVYPMKWGYTGKSLLINARSETAAQKMTFREDWARHRCIVPASWYFEWEHLKENGGKMRTGDSFDPVLPGITLSPDALTGSAKNSRSGMQKYRIKPKSSDMTWLCGLYRIENGMPVFVILTREPGEEIRFIHDRMPLIMPEELVNEWIRPDAKPEELLPHALTEMTFARATGAPDDFAFPCADRDGVSKGGRK